MGWSSLRSGTEERGIQLIGTLELEQAQPVLDAGMWGTDEVVQQVPLGFLKPP